MISYDIGNIQKSFISVSSDYYVKDKDLILLDTTSNLTIHLPKNPHLGYQVVFYDSNNLLKNNLLDINTHGKKLEGKIPTGRTLLQSASFLFTIIYSGDSFGWIFDNAANYLMTLGLISDTINGSDIIPMWDGYCLKTNNELLYFGAYGPFSPYGFVEKMQNMPINKFTDKTTFEYPRRFNFVKLCDGQYSNIAYGHKSDYCDFLLTYWDGSKTIVKYNGRDPQIINKYPKCAESNDTIFTFPEKDLKCAMYGVNDLPYGFFIYNNDVVYSVGQYNLSNIDTTASIDSPTKYNQGFSTILTTASGYALGLTKTGDLYSFGKFNVNDDNTYSRIPKFIKSGISKITRSYTTDSFIVLTDTKQIYGIGCADYASCEWAKINSVNVKELRSLPQTKPYNNIQYAHSTVYAVSEDKSWYAWGLNYHNEIYINTGITKSARSYEINSPAILLSRFFPPFSWACMTESDNWLVYTDQYNNLYECGSEYIGDGIYEQYNAHDVGIQSLKAFYTYPAYTKYLGNGSSGYATFALNENGYVTKLAEVYIGEFEVPTLTREIDLSQSRYKDITTYKNNSDRNYMAHTENNDLYVWTAKDLYISNKKVDSNVDKIYNYNYYMKSNSLWYYDYSTTSLKNITISLPTISQITNDHILDNSGDVWSYSGDTNLRITSVSKILSQKGIKKIASNSKSSYALTSDGEVYSWGLNNFGQLGIGNTMDTPVPTKMLIDSTTHNNYEISGSIISQSIVDVCANNDCCYMIGQCVFNSTDPSASYLNGMTYRYLMFTGKNTPSGIYFDLYNFGRNPDDTVVANVESMYTSPIKGRMTFYHPYDISLPDFHMDEDYDHMFFVNDGCRTWAWNEDNDLHTYPIYVPVK